MGTLNLGNQHISYHFKQNINSKEFNVVNYQLHQHGIYSGGGITKISNTEISIDPFVCLFEDTPNLLSIRIETTELAQVAISDITPFIIGRFTWVGVENNFLEFKAVSIENILSTDIIFGYAQFTGSILSTIFDYSKTTYANKKVLKLSDQMPFLVYPTLPTSNQIEVDAGGPIFVDGSFVELSTKTISPVISLPAVGNYRKDFVCINTNNNDIVVVTGNESTTEGLALFPTLSRGYYAVAALVFSNSLHTSIRGSCIHYMSLNEVKSSYSLSSTQVLEALKAVDGPTSGLDSFSLDSISHTNLKTVINNVLSEAQRIPI